MICPKCQKEVEDQATVCTYCGASLQAPKEKVHKAPTKREWVRGEGKRLTESYSRLVFRLSVAAAVLILASMLCLATVVNGVLGSGGASSAPVDETVSDVSVTEVESTPLEGDATATEDQGDDLSSFASAFQLSDIVVYAIFLVIGLVTAVPCVLGAVLCQFPLSVGGLVMGSLCGVLSWLLLLLLAGYTSLVWLILSILTAIAFVCLMAATVMCQWQVSRLYALHVPDWSKCC